MSVSSISSGQLEDFCLTTPPTSSARGRKTRTLSQAFLSSLAVVDLYVHHTQLSISLLLLLVCLSLPGERLVWGLAAVAFLSALVSWLFLKSSLLCLSFFSPLSVRVTRSRALSSSLFSVALFLSVLSPRSSVPWLFFFFFALLPMSFLSRPVQVAEGVSSAVRASFFLSAFLSSSAFLPSLLARLLNQKREEEKKKEKKTRKERM